MTYQETGVGTSLSLANYVAKSALASMIVGAMNSRVRVHLRRSAVLRAAMCVEARARAWIVASHGYQRRWKECGELVMGVTAEAIAVF